MLKSPLVTLLLLFATPSLSDEWCVGRDAVPHDDGRYRFSYESWVRFRHNAFMYGRCVKVLAPTEKLLNHWEGVLPRSIAQKGRPTTGGRSFVEKISQSHSATLHYGNSDDMLETTFIGHQLEPNPGQKQESRDESFREKITKIVDEVGKFVLESSYSFSLNLVEGNEASIADIDFKFVSTFDGNEFQYAVDYSMKPASSDFSNVQLTVQFDGSELAKMHDKDAKERTWMVASGRGEHAFAAAANETKEADFVDHQLTLTDAAGRSVAVLPVSYLLPARE